MQTTHHFRTLRRQSCIVLTLVMTTLSLSRPISAAQPVLIFVHGIEGAELQTPNRSVVWLTLWQALGLSSPDLSLPSRWDVDTQSADNLEAGKILDQIEIIPRLYSLQIYGPWLTAAAKLKPLFFPFAYDWRRDNRETAKHLERFIDDIRSRTGQPKVILVGHSMGGLLALSLVNQHPEHFSRIILAGTPLRGGIGFLPDLQAGVSIGINSKILAPQVLWTFPSVFSLFPTESNALLETSATTTPTHFFQSKDWEEKKLGPYANGRRTTSEYDRFFSHNLQAAEIFRKTLSPRSIAYPPIDVICGNSKLTLVRGRRNLKASDSEWDFTTEPMDPGDGRVALSSCTPPVGIPYELFLSKVDHSNLLNDPTVIAKIQEWILQ